MTTLDAIQTYLTQCAKVKKLEALTLKAYEVDLRQFYAFTSSAETLSALDKTLLSQYIDFISAKYSAKSLKRKVASLKAFFNYLESEDLITVTPFRKIKLFIKEPKRIPKSLTLGEMERLLSYLYTKSKTAANIRNKAVFELLFSTGIRISELCNIQLSDMNMDGQTIIIKGKGNKERIVFIGDAYTITALNAYMAKRSYLDSAKKGSGYFFINRDGNKISTQSMRLFVKTLGQKILGKHLTPHMLRHTFATLLLEEGVDITYIKSFLGHSSISTTQIYAASTTYRQRQILTSLHPRNRIKISLE